MSREMVVGLTIGVLDINIMPRVRPNVYCGYGVNNFFFREVVMEW